MCPVCFPVCWSLCKGCWTMGYIKRGYKQSRMSDSWIRSYCASSKKCSSVFTVLIFHLREMQTSTVLLLLTALVVGCVADHGSVVLFDFGRQRIEGNEHDNGRMTGCDDCSIKAKPVLYHPIRFEGDDYKAFSVHSNGYITLYRDADSKVQPYPFEPQPITSFTSSDQLPPVLAPLWSDIDLYCESYHDEDNSVYYEETTNPASLYVAASIVSQRTGDMEFRPQSMLVFTWDSVQRYNCPEDGLTNTFQVVVAIERTVEDDDTLTRTYVIMLYRSLGWALSEESVPERPGAFLPVAGVGDGRGGGVDLGLTSDINSTLIEGLNSGIIVFRVDDYIDSFAYSTTATMQADVLQQQFPEKRKSAVSIIQEKLRNRKFWH